MSTAATKEPPIDDLRSALERLKLHPGHRNRNPVDPNGELAGVYKRVGAGGTVDRPAGRSNQTVRGFATVSAIGLLHREHKL
jgi:hypothetical protein